MTSDSAGVTGPTGPENATDGWYISMGESVNPMSVFKGETMPAWKVSWQRVRNREQVDVLIKELSDLTTAILKHRVRKLRVDIVWCLKIGSPAGQDELAEELYYAEGELSSRQNKHLRLLRTRIGYPTIPPKFGPSPLENAARVKAYQGKLLNAQRAVMQRHTTP